MPTIGDTRLRPSFWERVVIDGSCWRWTGAISPYGYGATPWAYRPDESPRAHKVAYLALVGPIPQDLVLDHLCRHRWCVNPDHLEPVTPRENILRGEGFAAQNARATHCIDGHELCGPNLYVTPDGRRQCRACGRRRNAAHQARKRVLKRARDAAFGADE